MDQDSGMTLDQPSDPVATITIVSMDGLVTAKADLTLVSHVEPLSLVSRLAALFRLAGIGVAELSSSEDGPRTSATMKIYMSSTSLQSIVTAAQYLEAIS